MRLREQEAQFKESFKGQKLQESLKLALGHFKTLHPLEQKRILRAFIFCGEIRIEESGEVFLDLYINVDPNLAPLSKGKGRPSLKLVSKPGPVALRPNNRENNVIELASAAMAKKEKDLFSTSAPLRELRDEKWPFIRIGRPTATKGQLLTPHAYLVDSIQVLEAPRRFDKSFLHAKYVVEGLSAKTIADLLECGLTTVKARLKEFGIAKGGPGLAVHRKNMAYGKKLVGTKVITHKAELQVTETIRKMHFEQGLGPSAIAGLLDTMKVPTKRQGKKWDHSMVIGILKREGAYKQSRKSPQKRGKK